MDQAKNASKETLVIVSGAPDADASFLAHLQEAGYELANCKDPNFSNKIIESRPRGWMPDLFIVDVIIPKSSGFEIVRRITAAYGKFNIPIAMMSPYAAPEDKLEASNAGAVTLLKKPFSPDAISELFETERVKKMKNEIGKAVT